MYSTPKGRIFRRFKQSKVRYGEGNGFWTVIWQPNGSFCANNLINFLGGLRIPKKHVGSGYIFW